MSFEYSFADDTYIIKETNTKIHLLCNELKNVLDAFIKNKVFVETGRTMIIECKEHESKLELNSALTYFGKPMKTVDGTQFSIKYDGVLVPVSKDCKT